MLKYVGWSNVPRGLCETHPWGVAQHVRVYQIYHHLVEYSVRININANFCVRWNPTRETFQLDSILNAAMPHLFKNTLWMHGRLHFSQHLRTLVRRANFIFRCIPSYPSFYCNITLDIFQTITSSVPIMLNSLEISLRVLTALATFTSEARTFFSISILNYMPL